MATREMLLTAWGILEYDSTLTSLRALHSAGLSRSYLNLGRIRHELVHLCNHWLVLNGDPVVRSTDHVVEEVRAWATEHMTEIDDLLAAEGVNE